jgi:hypothetical protein
LTVIRNPFVAEISVFFDKSVTREENKPLPAEACSLYKRFFGQSGFNAAQVAFCHAFSTPEVAPKPADTPPRFSVAVSASR